MFEKIFIEESLLTHPKVLELTTRFPHSEQKIIQNYEDYFGRVKKPYLQKRDNLNLYLATKKGSLVKEAPAAYGLSGEPHYYFVHAFNCIYECNYCYLQGYFDSPDIVLFLNHDEIRSEIIKISQGHSGTKSWFHAGEYSDSLALSHLTGELPFYFELFKQLPESYLELRTKSVNIKELKKLCPQDNIITSFSLAPQHRAKINDLKTPSTRARLDAIAELHKLNFPIAIHLDPMIYDENFENAYFELIQDLCASIDPRSIRYISLGVVRFTKEVYYQVQKNYPESDLHAQEFVKSFDNKIRYTKPMRLWMLQKVKSFLVNAGVSPNKIYLCMEEEKEEVESKNE